MSGTVTVDRVKCACSDCACVVEVARSIQRDGRIYCSDACADHHRSGLPACRLHLPRISQYERMARATSRGAGDH
jgi:hypothetical protein